jgi:hypothetical protein
MKEDEVGGALAHMGEVRNALKMFVGRLEGKKALGRPRRRWENNIKTFPK